MMPPLPDYECPPVVEVAIGIQFAPLDAFTAGHVGLYWATVISEFPQSQEKAPILHIVEPADDLAEHQVALQLADKPDIPRSWFISPDGTRLLQVQRDRFLHNWRKVNEADAYPRFPSVKSSFVEHWEGFCAFLKSHGLEPVADQCELTYVNHLRRREGWERLAELERVLPNFVWKTRTGFLPEPNTIRWHVRFALPNNQGRLYVEMMPVRVEPQNEVAIRLSLTARGRPAGAVTTDSANSWFMMAREWIVRGFADLVDSRMDEIWRRKA